jgi:hypothetical protein
MIVMIVLRSSGRGQLVVMRTTVKAKRVRAAAGDQEQNAQSGNHATEEARRMHHISHNYSRSGHCLPLIRRAIALRG